MVVIRLRHLFREGLLDKVGERLVGRVRSLGAFLKGSPGRLFERCRRLRPSLLEGHRGRRWLLLRAPNFVCVRLVDGGKRGLRLPRRDVRCRVLSLHKAD
jgi:hypothetical protein